MIAHPAPKLATDADRTIGSRIAALRVAQGLSQAALGTALGVSFQQVQKYEKGRNRIGAGRLQAIADVLKVPVETFFTRPPASGRADLGATTFLEDPQVMELVSAFVSITDTTTRAGVLAIVKATAGLRPKPERA
ncbi:helix-turn-helix domain-containing protein [Methylobacterium sp. J-030]|uniref:helix-turn-helix domain-containing protein n=1 Tax=Methylobacterium sp. J-030 TaxID=2836627 RepID=UPI001FBA0CC9|nr:helix-turn-helix transcriptional regulator [Methylobacterium sp. J-030]MCJ2072922.1 helix-turn-helix domain-containing protein [Methylobacterium sp. J-030]